jgi:hypothetical protein
VLGTAIYQRRKNNTGEEFLTCFQSCGFRYIRKGESDEVLYFMLPVKWNLFF